MCPHETKTNESEQPPRRRSTKWRVDSPSLPRMLECGFEPRLGLEFSGFSMWHFLKLVVRGFLWVLQFPPLLHRVMVSANEIKLK